MRIKLLSLLFVFSLLISCSDGSTHSSEPSHNNNEITINYEGTYTRDLAGTTLNVFNWGEYISDGGYSSIDVNKEFEKLTGIKINYLFFDSNETMYTKVKGGGVSYDIIIPSDYMIAKMKNEGLLQKLDFSKLSNYKYIADEYKNQYYDANNEYSVPYNVGMVGIIYNTSVVKEKPDSWDLLWNKKYKDDILNFNNPRDAFGTAQKYLGISFNTTDEAEWQRAADALKQQKEILRSYVMDEIYDKMEIGEAAIAPYYAGDYLSMYENNNDLAFYYPKEGTNIFVDAVCVPKNANNFDAAMMYINFLLEPEIALANAEYICYASPNLAVINNENYTYYQNEILYPSEENRPNVEFYYDMDEKTKKLYESLWEDVKLH